MTTTSGTGGRAEQAPRPDALVTALVEVALERAWLHEDPASYRAGVLALRDQLEASSSGAGPDGRLRRTG